MSRDHNKRKQLASYLYLADNTNTIQMGMYVHECTNQTHAHSLANIQDLIHIFWLICAAYNFAYQSSD